MINQPYLIFVSRIFLLVMFFISQIILPQRIHASVLNLPEPGTRMTLTTAFQPALVRGIKIDPADPLHFNFLIQPDQAVKSEEEKKVEYNRLISYFLASMTTDEDDMWVNLSPYEGDKRTSTQFAKTEMGRDMLAQDYLLKQLSASLFYPETSLGKEFWNRVYARIQKEHGSYQVPVNTINKVWIVPSKATVFEKGNVAIVANSHLKVMLEEDYLALDKNNASKVGIDSKTKYIKENDVIKISNQVIREILLPEIENEVNNGKSFIQLRQMFNSMILASWFKKRIKLHLLNQVYVNKNLTAGVNIQNTNDLDDIYTQYLKAFKKGAYNYIKEEVDVITKTKIARKYFSGGVNASKLKADLAMTGDPTLISGLEVATLEEVDMAMTAITSDKETEFGYSTWSEYYSLEKRRDILRLLSTSSDDLLAEVMSSSGDLREKMRKGGEVSASQENLFKALIKVITKLEANLDEEYNFLFEGIITDQMIDNMIATLKLTSSDEIKARVLRVRAKIAQYKESLAKPQFNFDTIKVLSIDEIKKIIKQLKKDFPNVNFSLNSSNDGIIIPATEFQSSIEIKGIVDNFTYLSEGSYQPLKVGETFFVHLGEGNVIKYTKLAINDEGNATLTNLDVSDLPIRVVQRWHRLSLLFNPSKVIE